MLQAYNLQFYQKTPRTVVFQLILAITKYLKTPLLENTRDRLLLHLQKNTPFWKGTNTNKSCKKNVTSFKLSSHTGTLHRVWLPFTIHTFSI